LRDIDVVVLAGGLGKRLQPQTGDTPKVLAQVNGIPFLDLLLSNIASQGFRRVILCTGYKAEEIESHYRHSSLDLCIEFSREEIPLGTGGAFKLAQKKIQSPVFFGLNGDCFCSVPFEKFFAYHNEKKALASLVLNKVEEKSDFGSVVLSENNEIINFQEKANLISSPFVSVGIYCFDKKAFDHMPAQNAFSIEREFFPLLVGKGFYGFVTEHQFLDIGTPDRYQRAQTELH
ncbi:MAG TPA: sugar phosphate nucleotidyltransferase, partial [Candidatus Omnitrophota bacterium]|nr:sugar phosphate nucleotidyltransferase [Candidatus Omnitrophota bacterium]